MELHKFHVRDTRTRAERHRHAITRRDVGICRVEINLAATTRRQQRHGAENVSTRFAFLSKT